MHLVPRALNGLVDLSMLLGTVPWEKEIVRSNDLGDGAWNMVGESGGHGGTEGNFSK